MNIDIYQSINKISLFIISMTTYRVELYRVKYVKMSPMLHCIYMELVGHMVMVGMGT